ncbi:MAG: amino acid adenylation domain-containing protein, partial [Pseudomonas sp.]|uniref:amino acid adenylation domain-containing protein n=1 Tax=Pseudomonas sp. TaxID=306 RepID=UPI0033948705
QPGAELQPAGLRAALAAVLPDYMVPTAYVRLPRLPLTATGKLDRRALPVPDDQAVLQRDYQAPEGALEQDLAQLWSQLLGVERVGRQDHFFELGGHSLLAIRLISQLRQRLNIELPLAALFAHPRLQALAVQVAAAGQSRLGRIEPADRSAPLPLSPAQQRLWFVASVDARASLAYHIPVAVRLRGQLDRAALQHALDRILERHEALRTRVVLLEGRPCQVIDPPRPFALPIQEARDLPPGGLEALCQAAAAEPFDLAAGPLVRARLLCLADDDQVLLLTLHHLVADGWSLSLLMRECAALYRAAREGQADPLPPLALQYADYAVWQHQGLQGPRLRQQLEAWAQQLRGAPERVDLPSDRPRPALQDYRGASLAVSLDAELSQGLKGLAQRHGATLYMTLLAAWAALVARLSGQAQVVIGSPHAGRNRVEVEPLIGLFINTQAVKIDLQGAPTTASLLAQVRETTLAAQARQEVPFERLVEALNPSRSMAHHPVFQLMLAWHNTPPVDLHLDGLAVERVDSLPASAQFELALDLEEQGEGIVGRLNYATALFDAPSVARHWRQLQALLRGMLADDQQPLERIDLLDSAERQQLLQGFNPVPLAATEEGLVYQGFEHQARTRPAATALSYEGQTLSYAELNRRANQLAHYLREYGVRPDDRVALCLERGIDALVALLATLKAGGAYVPLDPAQPDARLAYLLQDSAPRLLLTQAALLPRLRLPPSCAALLLDNHAGARRPWADGPGHDLAAAEVGLQARHLAYVIYTSGSTGEPKGVMVEHRQLVAQLAALQPLYKVGPDDRVLQFSAPGFDVALEEIFGALLHGATLVLRSDAWLDEPRHWCQLCAEQGLTLVNLPTLFWQRLAQAPEVSLPPRLRQIVIGGDAVSAAALEAWWQRPGHRPALANAYGPTETTVNASVARCAPDDSPASIGRPLACSRLYVLDGQGQPVPLGVVGELHIGGSGVARGYLGRPALSAERFVPDPFAGTADARMYRSGDLARWRADGSLEFLGRNDFQVKLRGYRIELGEVEAQLRALPGVAEAVVLARPDELGEPRLVAYLVATADGELEPADLRAQLAERLPAYMVPAAYVRLPALPLTASGKLDRQALPAPQDQARAQRAYAAPRGALEQRLAQLWSQLLGVEQVGRDDDFFELGGHSLLAIRLISQLRQQLDLELPLTTVFAQPRLAAQAAQLAEAEQNRLSAIEPADRSQPLPLSHAQQRLWFVTRIDAHAGPAYHIPGALRLRGPLHRSALRAAVQRIVERHEVLRTRFVSHEGQACQVIDVPGALRLEERDITGVGAAELQRICRQEAAAPFDLERGPLIRCQLLRLGEEDHLLLLTLHHIIADGWSLSVLAREFSSLYRAFCRGQADPLPALAIQYADYASWQRQWLQGPLLQAQLQYWVGQLQGLPALIALPTDRPRPASQDYRGATFAVELDEALSQGLRALGQRHGTTLYMTLLGAWAALLARLSGQTQVVIGSSVAGRNRAELEPLIGFFVNTQALRFDLEGPLEVTQLLAQARRVALAAQSNRDVPFEQVVEALNPPRSMAYNPIFQVRLAWQNTPEARLELDDLQFESLGSSAGSAQFDLSLDLEESGSRIVGQLNYASALFDEASVRRHWQQLQRLLRAMVADDRQALAGIELLDPAERQQLLQGFNDSRREYAGEPLLHRLFERQAEARPQATALVFDGQSLSYAELNRRANQLAHHLRAQGVRPDDRVALCLERGFEQVVALLATLKAGGAYVPLDPVHPDARLAYLLQDSAPRLLLTQARLRPRLREPAGCTTLLLDAATWHGSPWATASPHDPLPAEVGLDASHLAYVIYTSGSTGLPKGVMVEHRQVLNFLHGLEDVVYGAQADCQRVAWNSSLGFDMAVKAWGQLLRGRTLFLLSEPTRLDAEALLDFLERHAIEAMECTPSHLRMLMAAGFAQQRPTSLRLLLLGGEALDSATWQALTEVRGTRFINMYGPTECSVDALCGPVEGALPNVGRVMPNARVYLLDAQYQPVPLGVVGELYIGGAGVARGYLGREDMTAQRFLPDPFVEVAGARLYRTGDLGRWRADGCLEYQGRNDFQVKIRGLRIELGEIEAQLLQLAEVREALVLARQDSPGEPRLVAYVVARQGATLEPTVLRTQLAETLPDYMLPSAFVTLAALPLTANGKLDRQALPAPEAQALAQQAYEAPGDLIEQQLAELWRELLGVARVGRQDNFFELGGHSALAIQLIQRMGEQQLQVDVQMIFNAPTLAHLASATVQLEEVLL